MNHEQGHLAGARGLRIYWQSWAAPGPPRATVVIAHGAGEHSGRYLHVASRLVQDGFAVYAIDHRGHGRSEGPRALVDRVASAVADLDVLIGRAKRERPGTDLFLLGHSMGATIALCYAIEHQDRLAGLILTGPLAAIEAASPASRLAANVLSAVAPRLPLVAVDSGLVSRDPEVVRAYDEDPLVHHGKLPARTVAVMTAAIESFPAAVDRITIPTLIMYGTGDRLCPPAGSIMLEQRLGSSDKTLKAYEGLYHEILNEPEQDIVLDDLCAWLSAHAAVPVQP